MSVFVDTSAVDAPSDMAASKIKDLALFLLVGVLIVIVLAAVLAPWLAPHPPNESDILSATQGPSSAHLLGTDALGRDILSRLIYGARLSLLGPALIVMIATVLGATLAVSAAWLGGWYDTLVSRVLDLLFSIPGLLIAIIGVAVIGDGLAAPVVALSLAYTPYIARVVRSVALRERHLAYIESSQLIGYPAWTVCIRQLLPNLGGLIRAQATIAFGAALVDLAALSFLGLGVQPPTAEWGVMVAFGQSSLLNGSPWEAVSAGVMIVTVVLLVNLLGERLAARAEAG